jgi:hypothetical protein
VNAASRNSVLNCDRRDRDREQRLVYVLGEIAIDRYEMIGPKVQRHGKVALLTFNLVNYRRQADGSEQPVVRWNSTEVYARVDGHWRIIHSHWSYVKPDLKQPISEGT